jgi:peptidoglycan/LPS O-acetylase OafA/YrhL
LHHVCAEYLTGEAGLQPLQNLAAKGWLGVDLFFVLSGFVLSYVYAGQMRHWDKGRMARFLKLRLARVYPAHLATTLILIPLYVVGVAMLQYHSPHDDFSIAKLMYCLTLLNGWGFKNSIGWNSVSWSISSEWFVYLMFPLFTLWVGRVKSVRANVALIASVFALMFGLALLLNGGRQYMLGDRYTLLRVSSEFLAGCLAYNIFRSRPADWNLDPGILFALVGIAALSVASVPAIGDGLIVLLFVVLVLSLSRPGAFGSATFGSRAVVYLGDISYSIYLIHPTVMIALLRLTKHLAPVPTTTELVLIFVTYLTATIAGAHFLYRFVEEPARAYLRTRWVRALRIPEQVAA